MNERELVRQACGILETCGAFLRGALELDMHPTIDWAQFIGYINETLMGAAECSGAGDKDIFIEAYENIFREIERHVGPDDDKSIAFSDLGKLLFHNESGDNIRHFGCSRQLVHRNLILNRVDE